MSGRFLKRDTCGSSHAAPSRTLEPPFEETKPYVLTELGKQICTLRDGRCRADDQRLRATAAGDMSMAESVGGFRIAD
jgi:hypothetical protein